MKTSKFKTRFYLNPGITGLIVVIFLLVSKIYSQEKKTPVFGGMGFLGTGYAFFNLGDLNQDFTMTGFPNVENGSGTLGGGGQWIFLNVVIGGEGYGLVGASIENSNYRVTHGGGYGFFNLGYVVASAPGFMFYPILGIGGGGLTVAITDLEAFPASFPNILSNPRVQSYITTGGFMLNFSLAADLMVLGEKTEGTSGGLLLGLRVGYTLNTAGNNWSMDDKELSNPPASGMSGPYIRLTLGGGGFNR